MNKSICSMYHVPSSQIKSVPSPLTAVHLPDIIHHKKLEINSEEHLNGAMILSLKPKFRGSGQPRQSGRHHPIHPRCPHDRTASKQQHWNAIQTSLWRPDVVTAKTSEMGVCRTSRNTRTTNKTSQMTEKSQMPCKEDVFAAPLLCNSVCFGK